MSTDDPDDGMSDKDVDEAYDALDEIRADERAALREALTLLLASGPDAVLAAEGALRSRLNADGTYVLTLATEALHPEHGGIYWSSECDGSEA